MNYLYGEFTDNQIESNAKFMHDQVHRLLLYKDNNINETIFSDDVDFYKYFLNILYLFGGLNELIGKPKEMVALMSTLQAAYDESKSDNYDFKIFRKLILDAHGYIKAIFEGGVNNAKP